MNKTQTWLVAFSVKRGGMRIRANLHSCQVNHRM